MTLYISERQDIVDILRQTETFQGLQIPVLDDEATGASVRRKLHRLLSPRSLARYEPALRTQAASLIESIAAQGQGDAIFDLAFPYTVASMLIILGLPQNEYNRVLGLGYRRLVADEANESRATEAQIRWRYLRYALKQYPPQGIREDLLTGDDALTDDQIIRVCDVILVNGLVATAASMANCFYRLAGNWGVCHGLRLAPNLIKPFIEKVLREDSPVAEIPRTTTCPVTLPGGLAVDAGEEIGLNLREANRTPGASLAFSRGVHRCIGQHLARLEIEVLLSEWLRRVGDFGLAVPRSDLYVIRASPAYVFESLPLRWKVA